MSQEKLMSDVPPNIYSGDFEAFGDKGFSQQAVKELSNVFMTLPRDVLVQIIPSFHRVQKIFGNPTFLQPNRLAENVKCDLKFFCQSSNKTIDQVDQVIEILKKAEIILSRYYVYQTPYVSAVNEYEAVQEIDTRNAMITSIVWERWKPWEKPDIGLVDSLILHILGNLSYGKETTIRNIIRNREILYTTGNFRDDDDPARVSWIIKGDSGRRRFSPSAENDYVNREAVEELITLATGTPIQELLSLGETVESYAARHGISIKSARKILSDSLFKIFEEGISRFGWDNSLINRLQAILLAPERSDKEQKLPTNYELWSLFDYNQTDLKQLMGIIDALPPIQKQCILHRYHYLDPEIPSIGDWTRKRGISEKLYRTSLHEAFEAIKRRLNNPPFLEKPIVEIVDEASNFSVLKDTGGKTVSKETNKISRLLDLYYSGAFPIDSLNKLEKAILSYVIEIYESSQKGRVPRRLDVAAALGLDEKVVKKQIDLLLTFHHSDRLAMVNGHIEPNSRWHRIIMWTRENQSNPEVMLDIFALTPLQLSIYRLCCQQVNGYYLTPEQIYETLKKQNQNISGPSVISYFLRRIIKILESKPNINEMLTYLKNQNSQDPTNETEKVYKEILKRIKEGRAIGDVMDRNKREYRMQMASELGVKIEVVNSVINELIAISKK